jgi:hypothetical protein
MSATSYIPTTTAQVTRAKSRAELTGADFSSWYNASEGTLFAEVFTRKLGDVAVLGDVKIVADELGAKKYVVTYESDPSATEFVVDGSEWMGTIKRLTYWPVKLDAETIARLLS